MEKLREKFIAKLWVVTEGDGCGGMQKQGTVAHKERGAFLFQAAYCRVGLECCTYPTYPIKAWFGLVLVWWAIDGFYTAVKSSVVSARGSYFISKIESADVECLHLSFIPCPSSKRSCMASLLGCKNQN